MYYLLTIEDFRLWSILSFISYFSEELKCKMNFGIYLPAAAESNKVPVIYWLSGEYYIHVHIETKVKVPVIYWLSGEYYIHVHVETKVKVPADIPVIWCVPWLIMFREYHKEYSIHLAGHSYIQKWHFHDTLDCTL